jgi:GxxExxY protein
MNKDYLIEDSWVDVKEPGLEYSSNSLNSVTHGIIGVCFDVHSELGRGFSEVVYKDAVEYELKKKNISFEREKKFEIKYKDTTLPHFYYADFVVENQVLMEIKAKRGIIEEHFNQVINYLAVSQSTLALLINFGEPSLKFKRIILTN